MTTFELVEGTNNLKLVNKNLTFTTKTDVYVAQKVRTKLKMFRGEWYLNINEGIPYREEVFIKNPNLGLIEDIFKITILSIPEISELLSFTLIYDVNFRKLTINFNAKLINGENLSFEEEV